MTMSNAMEEAYAAVKADDEIYETIEMGHPSFAEPVRIVTGVYDDKTFFVPGVGNKLFQACSVDFTLPGENEDGPTQASVTIDGVSGMLRGYLKDAVQAGEAIMVTFRSYLGSEVNPGDVIDDLELWAVTLTATSANGTLKFREMELQTFPLATYDTQYYPALQNG